MKTISCFLLAALLISIVVNSNAQEKVDVENYDIEIPNVPSQGKRYHAKITLTNGQKLKGVITSIGDNSIQLEKVVYKNPSGVHPASDKSLQYNEVHHSDIHYIKIRATILESVGGFFVGTLAGAAVGGALGLGACKDCDLDNMLGLAVLMGGLGGVIGGPVGAFDGPFITKIKIAGHYSQYQKFKAEMERKRMKRVKKMNTIRRK